jgi:uncharacterized membrane protein
VKNFKTDKKDKAEKLLYFPHRLSNMKKQRIILPIILLLSILPLVNAATVQGSVYDIFLEELDKAIITIDTEPKQTAVSKQGTYSFNIPPGDYTITATYSQEQETYELEEPLTIKDDGIYTIDLILIPLLGDPNLDEDLEDIENLNLDITLEEPEKKSNLGLIITIIAMILIILYFHFSKSHFIKDVKESEIKSEAEEELEKVLKFIKEKGGRVTQKDIRKNYPSSEAKISLMIAEMESRKLVKKIKKGRGNIIILTKEGMKK